MDNFNGKVAGGICFCCLAVVSLILVLVSFASIEVTEYGLNYSWVANSIEEKGYDSGRYFTGLGHHFIKFPSTVVTIQFSDESDSDATTLHSRSKDGLEVELELSFQYQINLEDLPKLYHKFGMAYHETFVLMATDELALRATSYTGKEMIVKRTEVGNVFEGNLTLVMKAQGYVDCVNFQLRAVGLPTEYDNEIRKTEVKKQDILTATAEYNKSEIDQKTNVTKAHNDSQAILLRSNATAQGKLLDMNAYVKQFTLNQRLQAESSVDIQKHFGQEKQFLEYLRTRVVRDHPEANSIVALSQEL